MTDLSILTKKKKVVFEDEDGTKRNVTLYPFGFKFFNDAISIINKYFSCYSAVKDEYNAEVQFILGNENYDDKTKETKLTYLTDSFDEIGGIVRNVLASDESSLGDDIALIISFCCREQLDLNEFHWGEVGVLLAAAIEVNMDFFAQNKSKISLLKEQGARNKEEGKMEDKKDGESKSVA